MACYVYHPDDDVDFLVYERKSTQHTAAFVAHYGTHCRVVTDRSELQGAQVYKLAVIGEPAVVGPLRDSLPTQLLNEVYSFVHLMRLIDAPSLEMNHPTANKGDALKRFATRLGIARGRVLAVGDSENDIPMLSWARHGVSMPCANAEVRHAADEQLEGDDPVALAELLRALPNLPER